MCSATDETTPEAGAEIRIRPGTEADSPACARLHVRNITEGFLSRLGTRFLTRLYRRIARSPDSFIIVAEHGGGQVGFLAGSTDTARLYRRFVARDAVAVSLSCATSLLRNWRLALETLGHGRRVAPPSEHEPDEASRPRADDAELLALAVDPRWRGHGAGGALVRGFLDEIERRGAKSASVVLAADNTNAMNLYGAAGFTAARTFEFHRGSVSLLMRWCSQSSCSS